MSENPHDPLKPYDLAALKTYDLASRPSKVFHDDLGQPVEAGASAEDWLVSLPKQLAANDIRKVTDHLCRAYRDGRTGRQHRQIIYRGADRENLDH